MSAWPRKQYEKGHWEALFIGRPRFPTCFQSSRYAPRHGERCSREHWSRNPGNHSVRSLHRYSRSWEPLSPTSMRPLTVVTEDAKCPVPRQVWRCCASVRSPRPGEDLSKPPTHHRKPWTWLEHGLSNTPVPIDLRAQTITPATDSCFTRSLLRKMIKTVHTCIQISIFCLQSPQTAVGNENNYLPWNVNSFSTQKNINQIV